MSPTLTPDSTETAPKARIGSSEEEGSDTDDDDVVLDKHLKEQQHVKVGVVGCECKVDRQCVNVYGIMRSLCDIMYSFA